MGSNKPPRLIDIRNTIQRHAEYHRILRLMGFVKSTHVMDFSRTDFAVVHPEHQNHPLTVADKFIDVMRVTIEILQRDIGYRRVPDINGKC